MSGCSPHESNGPNALPLDAGGLNHWDSALLASAVGGLGYPGFRQFRGAEKRNPAIVLLAAISRANLEARVVESLPWLAAEYHDLNWDWLIAEARQRELQNRLGFLVALARRVARMRGDGRAERTLGEIEHVLDVVRLPREDTLCQHGLSEAERRWLRGRRSAAARHWNLLTDLELGHLPYAA